MDMDMDLPEDQSRRPMKKDQNKHRSVLQKRILPDGVELFYISKGKTLLKGYTKGNGILCCCCKEVVSPTMFESHAGRANSKKPYQHIFLLNGMLLYEYASTLKSNCQKKEEKNDLLCMVCHKSGELLFCEGCPRSFHKECVFDTMSTLHKRFCTHCQFSIKCLLPKANAVKDGKISGVVKDGMVSEVVKDGRVSEAVKDGGVSEAVKDGGVSESVKDGRVSGADPNEKITKQSIQIDSSCDQIACVLCRSYDFSTNGFNDQTSIVCDQCEKEYHIGCLKKDMNIVLKELPPGNWFCTDDCKSLNAHIESMVAYGPLMVKDSYMQLVKKKLKGSDAESLIHPDVRWYVFKGKDACEQYELLLTQAVDIFHDCFNPIIDSVTGEDFIPSMAYGRQMGSSNFSGVYSALLTVNSKVITAGMFRAFGRQFAELPVVATSQPYQGKGYFQVFMKCFERLLSHCRIRKLVIPAADNAKAMWIKKFGFSEVPPETLARYRETQTSMVAFQGTTLLERDVPQGVVSSMRKRILEL